MLRVLDSFYETHGDASKLKYKSLETHAALLGVDAKEYDFRRDDAVKRRISELMGLREAFGASLAYKTLDADALIYANPTRASLKAALSGLDSSWRAVYERAVVLSTENTALLSKNHSIMRDADMLRVENESLEGSINELRRQAAALLAENRYLRAALESWLYPDVANEILRREGVVETSSFIATNTAMEELVDLDGPASFDQVVAADGERMAKAHPLIERMKSQVTRGDTDA